MGCLGSLGGLGGLGGLVSWIGTLGVAGYLLGEGAPGSSSRWVPRSCALSLHSTLCTLHSALYTLHSALSLLCTQPSLPPLCPFPRASIILIGPTLPCPHSKGD
jgi:hypothetical protein